MAGQKKQKSTTKPQSLINGFWRSVWFFPVVLLIPLVILTALKISGTSVGTYHKIIYGENSHDPDLLFGQPRPIRSDEWLVTSQLTIAQERAGFPRVNQNLGNGKDISIIGSVPFKDWSSIFKSENLSFLVLNLEQAFAFKWWFMLYLLIISCYFFTLRIIGSKRFAVLFSIAIGLSPFIFWWYSNVTLITLAYGFLIMILGMRIINDEPIPVLVKYRPLYTKIIYALGLSYLLVSFGLILYPPFQIPVAIVVGAYLLGYFIERKISLGKDRKWLFKRLAVFALAAALTGVLLSVFVSTRSDALQALTNTSYPGKRVVFSGHTHPLQVFDGFLQAQLQDEKRGANFFTNQSEASNFILLSPFLILPAFFLTYYERKKKRRIDWLFVSIQLCVLFFFARAYLPFGSRFYKLFLLSQIPNERLIIGMGLASALLTLLVIKKLSDLKLSAKFLRLPSTIYSLICFVIVLSTGFYISHIYPKFISFPPKIILLSFGFCAIIFLVLTRRAVLAAAFLLAFSLASVITIHPLYRGLGWIEDNKVIDQIDAKSQPASTWVAADHLLFENFGTIASRDSISGVQPYPDLSIWKKADPKASDIYNRYAHVLFMSQPAFSTPLALIQKDMFEVSLNCSQFVKSNVDFVVGVVPINSPCLTLSEKIDYPMIDFYLYKISP